MYIRVFGMKRAGTTDHMLRGIEVCPDIVVAKDLLENVDLEERSTSFRERGFSAQAGWLGHGVWVAALLRPEGEGRSHLCNGSLKSPTQDKQIEMTDTVGA